MSRAYPLKASLEGYLFGWVVSSGNDDVRIFRSFLLGWSCSSEKDPPIYCLEGEGPASGILGTGLRRRLGLSASVPSLRPALAWG